LLFRALELPNQVWERDLMINSVFKKFNRMRVLFCTEKSSLYLSNGYSVYTMNYNSDIFSFYGKCILPKKYYLSYYSRIFYRFFRSGFHDMLITNNETAIGVVPHYIVRKEIGSKKFVPVFKIKRGTRPLNICYTPDDYLYFGEYFSNSERKEIYIYRSEDDGHHWNIVYTFPKGSIRHIHKILYDPYRKGLLVLTGDIGNECKVLFTPDNFKTVDELISGSQQARAVTAIITKKGIILPTDTPLEQNYIQFLDNHGKLNKISKIPGSCFYSCKVRDRFFISTAVEPSKINKNLYATLWGSKDGFNWKLVFKAKKDILSGKLFQYSNVILPNGINNSNYLFVTGIALKEIDGVTLRWRLL
jgi:hypothetical protein